MNHSSKVSDEVFYMDELADETSRPLTSLEEPHVVEPRIHSNLSATPTAPPMLNSKSDKSSMGNAAWALTNVPNNDVELTEETSSPEASPDNEDDMRERSNMGTFDSKLNLPMGSDGFRTPGRRLSDSRSRIQGRPDVNAYQQKKTLAQGMMDLALLSANANQFRYVLQTDGNHPYFYPSLAMIGISLFLQVAVGIGLIWNSRYNIKDYPQMCKANKANNWTVIGVFLVTILNVFISSFGVVDQVPTTAVTNT